MFIGAVSFWPTLKAGDVPFSRIAANSVMCALTFSNTLISYRPIERERMRLDGMNPSPCRGSQRQPQLVIVLPRLTGMPLLANQASDCQTTAGKCTLLCTFIRSWTFRAKNRGKPFDLSFSLCQGENGQNRIRTLDSELQPQSLTKPSTQGGTQIPFDPILARLVTAWPTLSDERKKIICSLLEIA